MNLDDATLDALADKLAPRLLAGLQAAGHPVAAASAPRPLPRMTPEQFAYVVERCPQVICRHIRAQSKKLPPSDVNGPPYLIHPRALERWGVTPEIALYRLDQYAQSKAKPAPQAAPLRSVA